jgi:hypothetical protein
MFHNKIIKHIIHPMHKFQKKNKITGMCTTNAQIATNYINKSFPECKAQIHAVYVLSNDYINIGHVIIRLIDGSVIEPSYEIACLYNVEYYFSYDKLVSANSQIGTCTKRKELEDNFLLFKKHADDMNMDPTLISEHGGIEYFNKQVVYVENYNKKY